MNYTSFFNVFIAFCKKKQLINIVLILFFSSFNYGEEFFWKFTILKEVPHSNVRKNVKLLVVTDPIDYTSVVRSTPVLPLVGFSQIVSFSQSYLSSPYILEVTIVDADNIKATSFMRSLVLQGLQPYLEIEYLTDNHIIDNGRNAVELEGTLQGNNANDASFELSNITWIFPLNIYKEAKHLLLFIPSISSGFSVVLSKRVAYHGIDFNYLDDINLSSYSSSGSFEEALFSFLSVVGKNDLVIISHDEFTTSLVKKLPSLPNSLQHCPNTPTVTTAISDVIVFFSQAGTYIFFYDDIQNIIVSQLIEFNGNPLCPLDVDLQPGLNQDKILVSGRTELLFLQRPFEVETDVKIKLVEIKDENNASICTFLSLPQCFIVCHTFATQCCNIYVLVKSSPSNEFILVLYKSLVDFKTGKWNQLTRFYDRLPSSYSPIALNYVLLKHEYHQNGDQISIKDITDVSVASNCVYIWGNVLLVYTLESSLLFVVLIELEPSPSPYFDGYAIKQFISERKGNKVALMTSNGDIWLGRISCCVNSVNIKKHSQTVSLYNITLLSNVIGLFFDSFTDLYILSLQSKVIKQKIAFSSENYNRSLVITTACPDMFHFIRRRMFVFKVPRVWPLDLLVNSSNSVNLQMLNKHATIVKYSTAQFIVHRVASYFTFESEQIGIKKWWDQLSGSNWYFSNAAFHEYLEYVSQNNLRINVNWIAYISKNDYAIKKLKESYECINPVVLYLDRNMTISITLTLEATNKFLALRGNLDLYVSSTNNSLLDFEVIKIQKPQSVVFHVQLTGKATDQHPTGVNLQSASAVVYPWHYDQSDFINSEEMVIEVKVGCPPGRTLHFDKSASIATLVSRGRGDIFGCFEKNSNFPCITLAEFFPTFFLMDHIFQEKIPFEGNFTIKVVGGGIGYEENIKYFTEEEIASYNYIPGERKNIKSLLWLATNDEEAIKMKDNKTGQLIFDINRRTKIIFECRINSPCGNIPLLTYNPSEYYLVVEVSNKNVDSSTNCDLTTRFVLLLVGIELNPLSHMYVMLFTIVISFMSIYMYYILGGEKGKNAFKKCLPHSFQSKKWRYIAEQFCLARKVHAKNANKADTPDQVELHDKTSFSDAPPQKSLAEDVVSPLIKISEATAFSGKGD